MEDKQIRLKVLTPTRLLFDQDVDFVILRASEGDLGVQYGHEPYSALLDYGMLRIFRGNKETDVITVLGGFATIMDNEVVVLSDMAERPDKLEEALKKRADERAAAKLLEQAADLDTHRMEMALRRSLMHMDVSSYSIIKGNTEKSND